MFLSACPYGTTYMTEYIYYFRLSQHGSEFSQFLKQSRELGMPL